MSQDFAPNRYILFLADPPVSSRFVLREEMQTAAALSYRQQILARQQDVRRELANRGIRVSGSVDTLLNAIFVTATPNRAPELQAIPGVIAVRPERRGHRTVNQATKLMNAPAAWDSAVIGGQQNAGKGMKIAILDTGIDQTHPAFQDSSLSPPAGFPKCNVQSDCDKFTNGKAKSAINSAICWAVNKALLPGNASLNISV